ncbi:N-6 DNA methylase [Brachybacterium sp. UMB0905]|uniref:N-6 DNA methylase n=1 Tax=Brachybacterium sp. UMB0905 TaxID=2069310 RepID=UPI000C7FAE55|nr:N-6 DNA methylase [Brachybacterium sp. UMB0905]PMC76049.1 SAM-dependent methyltransferase [Brachybacterium sp. UMB0905]
MSISHLAEDTAALRKARGAFFTPAPLSRFIAQWALRSATDRMLEPSAGDAEFMVAAAHRLRELAGDESAIMVDGVEIHPPSAAAGERRVRQAGAQARMRVADFFDVAPEPHFDAVIGNPPYIRYQDFTGTSRAKAQRAALAAGVALTGLASSWAAFTVHASQFLKTGGRLGLVLPAELLSVNYAAPVRSYLFSAFASIDLVLFEQQVFPEAEAEVVLLLAEGYGQGPAHFASFSHTRDAQTLESMPEEPQPWVPLSTAGKWTANQVSGRVSADVDALRRSGTFAELAQWGETTLGTVTGNNRFFALSPQQVQELGLRGEDTVLLSPPGSAHLRGLELTTEDLQRLGSAGGATHLFCPPENPTGGAAEYIRVGERSAVHKGYKCRTRRIWYRPPLMDPADLLLTYMNADTVRLVGNPAQARHLNSVHGLYLAPEHQRLGRAVLAVAALNSVTLLDAETVGRTYGGGILKMEPREADRWLVPSPRTVAACAPRLKAIRTEVAELLSEGDLSMAVARVDAIILPAAGLADEDRVHEIRQARHALATRRAVRGGSRGRR